MSRFLKVMSEPWAASVHAVSHSCPCLRPAARRCVGPTLLSWRRRRAETPPCPGSFPSLPRVRCRTPALLRRNPGSPAREIRAVIKLEIRVPNLRSENVWIVSRTFTSLFSPSDFLSRSFSLSRLFLLAERSRLSRFWSSFLSRSLSRSLSFFFSFLCLE